MIKHRETGKVEYEGAVVRGEVEHYNGFGSYTTTVEVFDATAGGFRKVGVKHDSEDYGTSRSHDTTVDATPEVQIAYAAQAAIDFAREALNRQRIAEQTLEKGKLAKVVKGRKVAKGTIGRIAWLGQTQFGLRAGLDVNGERVWTAASNLMVEPEVPVLESTIALGSTVAYGELLGEVVEERGTTPERTKLFLVRWSDGIKSLVDTGAAGLTPAAA